MTTKQSIWMAVIGALIIVAAVVCGVYGETVYMAMSGAVVPLAVLGLGSGKIKYKIGQTITLKGRELSNLKNHPLWASKGANPERLASIAREGVLVPGIISPYGVILAGHGRREDAVACGIPMTWNVMDDVGQYGTNGYESAIQREACYGEYCKLAKMQFRDSEIARLMAGNLLAAYGNRASSPEALADPARRWKSLISRMAKAANSGVEKFVKVASRPAKGSKAAKKKQAERKLAQAEARHAGRLIAALNKYIGSKVATPVGKERALTLLSITAKNNPTPEQTGAALLV